MEWLWICTVRVPGGRKKRRVKVFCSSPHQVGQRIDFLPPVEDATTGIVVRCRENRKPQMIRK